MTAVKHGGDHGHEQWSGFNAGMRLRHSRCYGSHPGVSIDESDDVKKMLELLGEINFWQIAMRPAIRWPAGGCRRDVFQSSGKPGVGDGDVFQFAPPALRRLMGPGNDRPASATFKVRCVSCLHKRPGRAKFQRVILEPDSASDLVVRATGQQSSGILPP